MPIYEYVCRSCGEEVERLQRISDEPLTECPACHAPELKRKISAAGFRLAGGGWYETDFKSDGKRNLARQEDSSKKADSTAKSGSDTGASSPSPDAPKKDASKKKEAPKKEPGAKPSSKSESSTPRSGT